MEFVWKFVFCWSFEFVSIFEFGASDLTIDSFAIFAPFAQAVLGSFLP